MSNHDSRAEPQRVHAITDAREAASIESSKRMRSYGIKMALRAVLFVAGAIIAATWNIWVGVALLAASAILPWIAVVDANLITDPVGDDSATFLNAPPVDALAPGQEGAEDTESGEAPEPPVPAAEADIIEGSFEPEEPGHTPGQNPGKDAGSGERGDGPRA